MHIPATFDTIKRAFLAVGVVALAASCYMTWRFGYSISVVHGVGLVCVTIAAALIFPAKKFIEDMGVGRLGRAGLAVLGCFFVGLELFADLGYTIGMRDKQMVEAGAQTVAYDATQENMQSERANLDMWRKQLADLKTQNAWSATVTATGLRASLESATKAVELEGKRGGCKSKCLELMKEKAKLEERIATLERTDDLSKRIEATQRILDRKVETATTTKKGHSTARAQVDFVSKGYLLLTTDSAEKALNPDQVTMTVSDWVIGLAMALGATFLPTTAFFIAFFSPATSHSSAPLHNSAPRQTTSATVRHGPAGGVVVRETNTVEDPRALNELRALRDRVRFAINSNRVAAA